MIIPHLLEHDARMRRKEFQEAARLARLVQEIDTQKPSVWHKLIWKVGDWMIVLGHRLREDNFNPVEVK